MLALLFDYHPEICLRERSPFKASLLSSLLTQCGAGEDVVVVIVVVVVLRSVGK